MSALLATLGGDLPLPDEFNYAAGLEYVVESRLTIVGDILGRTLRDAGRLGIVSKPFDYVTRNGGPVQTISFDEFAPRSGNLNLTLGTDRREVQSDGQPAHLGERPFPHQLGWPQEPGDAGYRHRLRVLGFPPQSLKSSWRYARRESTLFPRTRASRCAP